MDHWQQFKAGDFQEKWNSSKLIVKEGNAAITPLLELLQNPTADFETHWFTIRALGNFPEPEVVTAIAAQIGAADHYQRTPEQALELSNFAIETLAAMGTAAVDVLTKLLQDPQQRLLAAKALNQIRSNKVIPAMASIVNDGNATVRYYAIDALGSFHSPVVTPLLLAALTDPAAPVRKASVMALGRRRDLYVEHRVGDRLQPLLWDVNVDVCCQTALALGRLGADAQVPDLQKILRSNHTPQPLRIDTIRALAWCCDSANRSDSSARSADQTAATQLAAYGALTQSLEYFATCPAELLPEEVEQVLVAIVRVLADMHSMAQPVTHCLMKLLDQQPSVAIAQATIMALADLGQPQTFEALLPLLNHQAEVIQIHAIAALKRLDPDHSLDRVTQFLGQFPKCKAAILDLW